MKNIVTKRQIDELLEKSEIKVETVYDKVTIVNCKLPNGFVITEASGAVDPANYDEKIGTEICMAKIENKLWELEGYVLAKQLYEREETVMKPYIGVKKIEADPMTRGDYNTYRGWQIPTDENPDDEGYHVKHADGHESWSPKEDFENTFLEKG